MLYHPQEDGSFYISHLYWNKTLFRSVMLCYAEFPLVQQKPVHGEYFSLVLFQENMYLSILLLQSLIYFFSTFLDICPQYKVMHWKLSVRKNNWWNRIKNTQNAFQIEGCVFFSSVHVTEKNNLNLFVYRPRTSALPSHDNLFFNKKTFMCDYNVKLFF